MKKLALSLLFSGLLCLKTSFAADIKVGFVDIPYLIDKAPQAQAASNRLETEFAPRQAGIKAQKRALAELRGKLDGDDGELAESERATVEREFRKTERRVKRDEQEFREELNIQKNQEFKQVRIYVLDAIASFAKEHSYDLIISDGVLFANKNVDVTEQVLRELHLASDVK
ncbi:hypothetical protein AB833_20370 [Chromatiales bacterium (ex Bugula neritina AB1)]|nr:hypothetical protein AB833_20370 [Chromatiales bacterium (ex Bugula neritina AB1)]